MQTLRLQHFIDPVGRFFIGRKLHKQVVASVTFFDVIFMKPVKILRDLNTLDIYVSGVFQRDIL